MKREPDIEGVTGLEQKCVRPGYWRIEGYAVLRAETRPPFWKVMDDRAAPSRMVTTADTLREIRDWIKDNPWPGPSARVPLARRAGSGHPAVILHD